MQQVAVGRMHLRDLEAGSQGALGGAYEGLHQRLDLRLAQGLGGRVLGIEQDRRRRHRYPAAVADRHAAVLAQPRPPGTRLAPGVGQLDPGDRALGFDETGDAMQRLDMRVAPDAEVVSGDAPSGNTAVASTITRPAPPTARLPRCTRCQSLARPSCAEYWHMGDTAMRLGKVI